MPRPVLLALLPALAALAGCGPARPARSGDASVHPRVATAQSTGPRAPVQRRAPLRFELGGRAFPLPVVRATVAGHPTMLLVDTGANVHVVAGWLARKLALPLEKLGDVGSDHVGKTITTWRSKAAPLALEGWGPVGTSSVIVTEIPEAIEKLGIGGIVSPQKLGDEGDAVVLDLYRGELRAAWWDDAVKELAAGPGASFVTEGRQRACEEPDASGPGIAYVVPATIDGQSAALLVDTGAHRSDVFASSAPGQKLAPRSVTDIEPVYTASGKVSARKLQGARIVSGGFSVVGDVGLIQGSADSGCPRDGVLAMDVLRACTLVLGRARVAGMCTRIDGGPRL
jgi:predicted aspartyl protease